MTIELVVAKVFNVNRILGRGGGNLEATSWKQQLAVASLVGILAGLVARLIIPEYSSTPGLGPEVSYSVALFFVLGAFFLPFLWRRSPVGYVGAVVVGLLAIAGQTGGALAIADAGAISPGLTTILIPHYIFALLLIGSSVLAWREG